MQVTYYLDQTKNPNLYCRLSSGGRWVSFSLFHDLDVSEWNQEEHFVLSGCQYDWVLSKYRAYMSELYENTQAGDEKERLEIVKLMVALLPKYGGLEALQEYFFDKENDEFITYQNLIQSIEKLLCKDRSKFEIFPYDHGLQVKVAENLSYYLKCEQWLYRELSDLVINRRYSELYFCTEDVIWRSVLQMFEFDHNMRKFLSGLMNESRRLWEKQSFPFENEGHETKHLESIKTLFQSDLFELINGYINEGVKAIDWFRYENEEIAPLLIAELIADNPNKLSIALDLYANMYFEDEYYTWERMSVASEGPPFFYRENWEG
jgi:hypothetical protein